MSSDSESETSDATIATEEILRRMNEDWVKAAMGRDIKTLDRLMDDRCIFTDALIGDDKAQFLSDIASGDLQIASLGRDNVEVRVYGSTGVMTALDTADWLYKGRHIQAHYRTLHVYAESDGIWKLVAIQASHIDDK
jgi:ketosteroid isomerase-like protein